VSSGSPRPENLRGTNVGLLPEMSHPVHDGMRLAKHDADAASAGEGFLWFADRLLKGSNGDSPNPRAALGFLRQAAELGVPKAFLRIGEMCEAGIGTEPNLRLALAAYSRAAVGDDVDGSRAVVRVLRDLVRRR
jgi:TPR repeat protein